MSTKKTKKAQSGAGEKLGLERWAFLLAAVHEELGRRELETFNAALAEPERVAKLQEKLEKMAVDTGDDRQAAGWPRDVVLEQRAVDRLLAEDWWEHPAEILGSDEWVETDYLPLIRICAARRSRGEGDAGRLAVVEGKLRAAASGRAA